VADTKEVTFVHDDVASPLTFSPSSLRNTALQKVLSKSMAHRCVLNLFSSFYDNTFKGVPVSNVLETFSSLYKKLVPSVADFVLPMTHQSLARDKDLAQHMLDMHCGRGLIIGGHEHVPINETVMNDSSKESIRILKSGSDARGASLIDLCFDTSATPPELKSIDYTLVDLTKYEDSKVVKKIVDSHLSVLEAMNEQIAVQIDKDRCPVLSSERS
jgi:2',3'-cyclic-nucleotide 2'-phosphodiesterase (5'-nucleotidase family)